MADGGILVKPAQSRRGKGISLVYYAPGKPWGIHVHFVYVKTQTDYNCHPTWRFWRATPTFLCEIRALLACQCLDISVPKLASFRREEAMAELVLEEIPDAVSFDVFWSQASTERQRHAIFELGRMVGELHRAGWTHGALGRAHILVQPDDHDKVWIIDFEKARRPFRPARFKADVARFWRRSVFLSESDVDSFFHGYYPDDQLHKQAAATNQIKQMMADQPLVSSSAVALNTAQRSHFSSQKTVTNTAIPLSRD